MKEVTTEIIRDEQGERLRVVLAGKDYYLPFKLIGGRKVGFLDISGRVAFNESAADEIVDRMIEQGITFDTILNPVSKSSALAHAIAVRWAQRVDPSLTYTVVARKSSSPSGVEVTYRSVTTDHDQVLSLTDDDTAYLKGKKVLLLDDVYAAGGTARALHALVEKAGAEVVAHAVVAIEQGANIPEGLVYTFVLPTID